MKTPIVLASVLFLANMSLAEQDSTALLQQKLDIQTAALQDDLNRLNQQIHCAEDEMIEYMRLHDVLRVRARAEAEREKLEQIVSERTDAEHALLLMEARHPFLTDTNAVASVSDPDSLRSTQKELKRVIAALETAEYKWQHKNLLASQRNSDLKYLKNRLSRFENTRKQTADSLHNLRMKNELKSLQNK